MRLRKVCIAIFLIIILMGGIGLKKEGLVSFSVAETPTMQKLFEKAVEPIGTTMYIWGGGWDLDEPKAGRTATQIGVDAKWEEFARKQNADYDFEEHMEKQDMGLDCSGYVGWVIYNLFESRDGQEGYVSVSTGMAANFAQRGWGKLIKNPHEFLVGDIVSMQGHVWICLGTCEDGSVLLVHSSPPGVSVCGTVVPDSDGENADSIAVQLATEYMTTNFSKWQEKYPRRAVPDTYLKNVTIFRWNSETLHDAAEYQALSGEEMMENMNN